MKIINLNPRYTTQTVIALPFETDSDVCNAWEYIVSNDWLGSFDYRPNTEGEDEERASISAYLSARRQGEPIEFPDPETIRRYIPKIWQAEMNFDIRDLLDYAQSNLYT